MKDYYVFLLVLAFPLLIIAGLAIVEPVPQASGVVHPEFKTMLHSANSQASSSQVKYLGFAFGISIIAVFGLCLYWGSKRTQQAGFRKRDLWVGMILYLLTFSALVFSSWKYDHIEAPLWGELPIPTAWMLYGIWFVPVVFIILYVSGFRKHVLSEEDEAAFQKIIEERIARQEAS